MKTLVNYFVLGLVNLVLNGCGIGGMWMNGNPHMEPIQPYGSHWIKERMTKEQRRADSWSCGAASTVHAADHVVFTKEQRDAVRLFTDKDNYGPDERLLNQWRICMQSKGYVYIDKCDARCLYP
jgi:hypothetical protein